MLRPAIFENETVYGWIARHHIKVGVGAPSNTLFRLLGSKKVRIHPYLPNHLEMLCTNTNTEPLDWLVHHSLYPLFSFFNACDTSKLKVSMLGNKSNVVSQANIPQAKLEFAFGHHYCPECIKIGRQEHGFGILDIRHQIPGLRACPLHHCKLNTIACGDFGVDRTLTYSRFNFEKEPATQFQIDFAKFCIDVFENVKQPEEHSITAKDYKQHLNEKGYLASSGRLRYKAITQDMSKFFSDFSFTDGFEPLEHFNFLGPLLRDKTQTHIHPTKQLLFAYWLFDKDPNLLIPKAPKQTSKSKVIVNQANIDSEIISMLESSQSFESIHFSTGKSRCYIRRLCELNDIEHQSNANAIPREKRNMVVVQAKLGRHRQQIADNLNLGLGYVEQVISNTPGLVAHRKKLWILRKVRRAYRELSKAKKQNPSWFRKDFKLHHNQAFFYLYRNARRLLESILPVKLTPIRVTTDWVKEDLRLLKAISNLKNCEQLSVSAIGYKVKDHGHLRRNLDKLERTKALLTQLKHY